VTQHAAASHDPTSHSGHAHGDSHSPGHYKKIYVILLVLLCISVAGPFLGIQWVTLVTAFGVAAVKAFLVGKHFMHVDVPPRFVMMFVGAALTIMFLFFFAIAPDVMAHDGANWENVAAKAETARALKIIQEHAAHGGVQHGAAPAHGAHE
jgi:caa(3)-type oxidase subunit IV